MVAIFLTLVAAACILLIGEYLHRAGYIGGEASRKFVHIVFGIFVATWPYYLQKNTTILLGALLLAGICASYFLHVFTAIHSTRNRFIGEMLYAVGIVCAATLANQPWVFTTSVLVLALPDGMAAVVGTHKKNRTKKIYKRKTVAGTFAFLLFCYVALAVGVLAAGTPVTSAQAFVVFAWLPVFLTLIELTAPWGTDNVLLPVFTAFVLQAVLAVV
jgi:dolichol kinase